MHLDLSFWIDLAVIALYFVSVVWVGLKFGQRDQSLEGFALGGHSMPWWAVLASIIAAETSAATFLGTPGEGFELLDYTYLQIALGTILGAYHRGFSIHQAVFRLQGLFHLRVFANTFRSRNAHRRISCLSCHKSACVRCATLCRCDCSGCRHRHYDWNATDSNSTDIFVSYGAIVFITALTAIYTSIGGIESRCVDGLHSIYCHVRRRTERNCDSRHAYARRIADSARSGQVN